MIDNQGTNLFKILYLDWQQKYVNIKARKMTVRHYVTITVNDQLLRIMDYLY